MTVFDPHLNLKDVVLVGVGGTGAQLARSVARLVYAMDRGGLHVPSVTFIDPDTVDERNLGRQLFSYGDIGQNKARTLAARFNAALGLNIAAIDSPFDAERHIHYGSSTLLIGAVDNELARTELAKVQNALWLDCGNLAFTNAGQVVLGNTDDLSRVRHCLNGSNQDKYAYLPNAALLFPELLEPEPPLSENAELQSLAPVSCADIVIAEQGLFVNDLVASVAAQYLWRILYCQPLETFASFVNGDHLSLRSLPVCRDELLAYLEDRNVEG